MPPVEGPDYQQAERANGRDVAEVDVPGTPDKQHQIQDIQRRRRRVRCTKFQRLVDDRRRDWVDDAGGTMWGCWVGGPDNHTVRAGARPAQSTVGGRRGQALKCAAVRR